MASDRSNLVDNRSFANSFNRFQVCFEWTFYLNPPSWDGQKIIFTHFRSREIIPLATDNEQSLLTRKGIPKKRTHFPCPRFWPQQAPVKFVKGLPKICLTQFSALLSSNKKVSRIHKNISTYPCPSGVNKIPLGRSQFTDG